MFPIRVQQRALAAALLSVAALSAQAEIVVYGIADAAVRAADGLRDFTPSSASARTLTSGVNETSRWGLRGREDLGSGLAATLNLESGLNIDTGTPANSSKFWDRAATVGLEGRWAALTLGRARTVLGDAVAVADPLGMRMAAYNPGIQIAGLSQVGLGVEYGPSGSSSGSYRLDNSIKLQVRSGGFTAAVMTALGERDHASQQDSNGLRLQYDAGALTVSAAHQRFHNAAGADLKASNAGAALRWGAARATLLAAYSEGANASGRQIRHRLLGAGLGAPLADRVQLTLACYDVDRDTAGQGESGYLRTVAFTEYALSKRTKAYAEVDHNRARGNWQGTGNDATGNGLSLGISHRF